MCDSGKGETFCERSKKARSARKISRCARNEGMGEWVYFTQRTTDMFGKRYSSQRHPERSRGIFLTHRYSAVCVIAEKGKPFAKRARKSGVRGIFLDFAGNDGMGGWVYFTQRTTDMFGKRYSCIVIPSEAEGSFLQEGIMSYV